MHNEVELLSSIWPVYWQTLNIDNIDSIVIKFVYIGLVRLSSLGKIAVIII